MTDSSSIPITTTDYIPHLSDRQIRFSQFTWSMGHESVKEAYAALEGTARSNGYDAVVGVRLEAHPNAHYGGRTDDTFLTWAIYGTAIVWLA